MTVKKPKPVLLAIASVLLSFIPVVSYAGMYISGAFGLSDHRFANVGDAASYTLGIGYRPTRGGLGGEIGYVNAGSAVIGGVGNLDMSGTNVSAVYWIPNDVPELAYMRGYVKLGVYSMTATVVPSTADSSGISAGMGFEFRVKPGLGLYADVDGFALIDATNANLDNLTVWSFGVRYHF
jgi:hypothetical protein